MTKINHIAVRLAISVLNSAKICTLSIIHQRELKNYALVNNDGLSNYQEMIVSCCII